MSLRKLHQEIISCSRCPRLREHCREVARIKRKAYQEETYWGQPLPGFGDPRAKLLVVGLAPAAHGANRTGRVFTGDRSGDWLFRALHKSGFANQAESVSRDDGLALTGAFVTCVGRCAPPDNKPLPDELEACSSFLVRELKLLKEVKVILALGQIALQGIWRHLEKSRSRPKFGHGASVALSDGRHLLMSYHPSQQNTFTGRLTEPMLDSVFREARTRCKAL